MDNAPKVSFRYLCNGYKFDNDALFALSEASGVAKSVIDVMIVGSPVERDDAIKVLFALSEQVRESWALDNVNVPLVEVRYG